MPALQEILGYFLNWKSLTGLWPKNVWSVMVSQQTIETILTNNGLIFFSHRVNDLEPRIPY